MISVLILTKNEEQDLPGCLESVSWSDDIHVFDSFSSDRTVEIARSFGAHVLQRPFDTYAAQRNAALQTVPFRHEWIFLPDADERPTPPLIEEMRATVGAASPQTGAFRIRRRDFFRGRWLKHAQLSPYYVRLARRNRLRFVREVNEVPEVDGTILELHSYLDHFPFSKGIAHWLNKHNAYSTMEARIIASGMNRGGASLRSALFERDFHARRVAQKALFYRMPARPWIKWLYMVFMRRAILDGSAGIEYANLQALYEYMIVLKTREMLAAQRNEGGVDSQSYSSG